MSKLTSYIIGFVLSLVLTILPLVLLHMHNSGGHAYPTHTMLFAGFVLFAILQMLVQLYCFLHMGEEARPRLNLQVLIFALLVVVIVVGGTLWIMRNLTHSAHETEVPFIKGTITPEASND